MVLHRLPSMLPIGDVFPGRPVRLPRLYRTRGPVQKKCPVVVRNSTTGHSCQLIVYLDFCCHQFVKRLGAQQIQWHFQDGVGTTVSLLFQPGCGSAKSNHCCRGEIRIRLRARLNSMLAWWPCRFPVVITCPPWGAPDGRGRTLRQTRNVRWCHTVRNSRA